MNGIQNITYSELDKTNALERLRTVREANEKEKQEHIDNYC